MKELRKAEIQQIKRSLPIYQLLKEWGIEPVRKVGNKLIYYSPFRNEAHPSFVVYDKQEYQDWFDFGTNEGGDIIDLTMKFWGISYGEAVKLLRKRLNLELAID
ncbi:hypothetical protein KEJ18_07130 [Candidatus Bathyarchaeota archaeon]|nr:hypothetical protein [Candidatus Bathyarchaeota archaeon]